MSRYSSYRYSGIEWLGEIPAHWEISKLKWVASVVLGKMLEEKMPQNVESAGYTLECYLKSKNIGWLELFVNENDVEQMRFSQREKDMYLLRDGDIVMNEGGDIGKVALWVDTGFNCYIQNSVHKISVIDSLVIPEYLLYLIYAASKSGYYWSMVNQISIAHLTKEKLENTSVLLPPLDEQRTIAEYLSEKVADIDAIKKGKEDELSFLVAYRQAIILEAITKGIRPDCELHETGVEWIGQIPEEWNVAKVGWLFDMIGSGTTPNTDNCDYYTDDSGIPWLQTGDLNDSSVVSTSKFVTPKAVKECHLTLYPRGSVVVAMYGATIGKIGLLNIDCCTNQACCVLGKSQLLTNRYTYYAFLASKQSLINKSVGGGQPNISQSIVREHMLPVPPLTYQNEITAYLDEKCVVIDTAINAIDKQINDLSDYKKALIYEVVTGKMNV